MNSVYDFTEIKLNGCDQFITLLHERQDDCELDFDYEELKST